MVYIVKAICLKCGKEFFPALSHSGIVNLCPACLQAEQEEKLENFLTELWKGRDTKQVVEELAKMVYRLQHKKPE